MHNTWYVYILRCSDGSLYTGVTTDINRRLAEHNSNQTLGASYTRSRRPVFLAYSEKAVNRSAAQKREASIKKMSRKVKLSLLSSCG
jgi:putative endonuclease